MDELQAHLVRGACQDVIARYAISVDAQDWEHLYSLLAGDCIWTRPATDPIIGPEGARTFFEGVHAQRRATNEHGSLQRHNVTTVRIDPTGEDSADATWYALVFQDDYWTGTLPAAMPPTPYLVVEYRTSFRRDPGGWKIVRHNAAHVFRAELAFPDK